MTKDEAIEKLNSLRCKEIENAKSFTAEAKEIENKARLVVDAKVKERAQNGYSDEYFELVNKVSGLHQSATNKHSEAVRCYDIAKAYLEAINTIMEIA